MPSPCNPETILTALRAKGATLGVAESCTGGMIAAAITDIAGCSDVFLCGVVSYANAAKTALLDVPADMLAAHGAVSEQVARAMAEGVRAKTGATYALSTTGIAGPTGGSADKPIGLVYIGCAGPNGTHVQRHVFAGNRAKIREQATQTALTLLLETVQA